MLCAKHSRAEADSQRFLAILGVARSGGWAPRVPRAKAAAGPDGGNIRLRVSRL